MTDLESKSGPKPLALGYARYSGETIGEGVFDARKSAQALLGFDRAVRHFASEFEPELGEIEYDLPVRVAPGSWEIQIPQTIGQWILTGGGVVAASYFTTAAKKMAERDFAEVGLRDAFANALRAIQWTIKIGKHVGTTGKKKFSSLKWRNNNAEVGIEGTSSDLLFVPRTQFELYCRADPYVLEGLVELVLEERLLSVGVCEEGGVEEATVAAADRHIFLRPADDQSDEDVLPDLRDGMEVELEGEVTRGNATTNSVGFRHRGHILDCHPLKGTVVRFKSTLFGLAQMRGFVSRPLGNNGLPSRKPSIRFRSLEAVEGGDDGPSLLDGV